MGIIKVRCSMCNRGMLIADYRRELKFIRCGRKSCNKLLKPTNLYRIEHTNKMRFQ